MEAERLTDREGALELLVVVHLKTRGPS